MRQVRTTISFIYNEDVFLQDFEESPRTDEEILEYCKTLMSEDLSDSKEYFPTEFIEAKFEEVNEQSNSLYH